MPLSKIVAKSITDNTITTDQIADTSVHGRRNLIINGACNVQQRGTQTGQGGTANAYTAVDRYQLVLSGAKTPRVTSSQQSTTTGEFANQLKLDCTTAQSSVAAADLFAVRQRIEGQNLQHLQYGTSSAKTLTASFTITSPKSGTHCVQLHHRDASYSYVREFTVDAADTAQRISVTFPGYTTTALDDDNASSLELAWPLLAGSNWQTTKDGWNSGNDFATSNQQNLLDNTSNDFLITGIQLEIGDKTTPFEHRSYGEELESCKRYFQKVDDVWFNANRFGDTYWDGHIPAGHHEFHPEMRAAPSTSNLDVDGWLDGDSAWSSTSTTAASPTGMTSKKVNFTGVYNWTTNYNSTHGWRIYTAEYDAEL